MGSTLAARRIRLQQLGPSLNSTRVNCGFDPMTPSTMLNPPGTQVQAVGEFARRMNNMIKVCSRRADPGSSAPRRICKSPAPPRESKLVLLSAANIHSPKKLQPRFIGPYKILELVSPVAVRLDLPPSLRIPYSPRFPHLSVE
jgi:hypothetical protein